jgi:hypothetical protein
MTGQQLIDTFKTLVDDGSLPDSYVLQLLNQAQIKLASDRNWEYLQKGVQLGSANSIPLPADFMGIIKVSAGKRELFTVRGDNRYTATRGVWVNYSTNPYTLNFIETPPSVDVDLVYKAKPSSITLTTHPNPAMIEELQPILAYEAAIHFYFTDQDRQLTPLMQTRLTTEYNNLLGSLIMWDTNLALGGQNNYGY